MNALIPAGGPAATMTSREIAELTGKRHPDVRRDIRNMLEALGKGVSSFARTYLDSQNKEQEEYELDRELTLTLVSGYDIPLRHRVVVRLAELEEQARNPIAALSRVDLLKLALDSEEKRQALVTQVAIMAPKVEAFDRIATSDGSLCLTDAAKTLQVQPRQFTQLLQEHHYLYRRPMGAGWLAYQDKIQQGLMEHKVTTGEKSNGSEWTSTQPRITAKGLTKLAEVVRQAGMH